MKVKGTPREKLAEAEFFLDKMAKSDGVEHVDKPGFLYYLSAFLSAASSVVEILKKTHNPGFGETFARWQASLAESERTLYVLMSDNRRAAVHGGAADVESDMHDSPIRTSSGTRIIVSVPGGRSPSVSVRVRSYFLTVGNERMRATDASRAYLVLLRQLIEAAGQSTTQKS